MEIPSGKTMLSAAASAATMAVLVRSIARDLLPHEIQVFLQSRLRSLFSTTSTQITIVIDEFEGLNLNKLFLFSELYLGTKVSPSTHRFRASIPAKETKIVFSMDENQEVIDVFEGVQFKWRKVQKQVDSKIGNKGNKYHNTVKQDLAFLQLSFHKKYKYMVFKSYLPYIVSQAFKFHEEKKTLKIHTWTNSRKHMDKGHPWIAMNLDHPSTFESLAMDPEMKKMIMEELDMFVRRRDYYRKVGKAWKRGYLLYGPPGTGKSSLIAAMANYLNFHIFDLELANLTCNSQLRKLLITTANKSILVVEDIDCTVELEDRKKQAKAIENPQYDQGNEITLSGLLNFIDGLWSSCGEERIIVFTTNHKERLDPALLRPGRMDVHIHMSYCTPCAFKTLAWNYIGIREHPLFKEVEEVIPTAKATPAEVGEQLMKSEDPEIVLRGLVEFLKVKQEQEKLKAKNQEKEAGDGQMVAE